MDKQTQAIGNDVGQPADDARALMAVTADVAGHKVGEARQVVDEITAWWQKRLGVKAVLGQASNRPPPGPRAPIPKLLWTQSESGHTSYVRYHA